MIKKAEKGNDGRGARSRLFRKVAYGTICFTFLIGVLHLLGFGNDDNSSSSTSALKRLKKFKKSITALDLRLKKEEDKETFHLSVDDPNDLPIIQRILDAELNLVDIGVYDKEELSSASSHSYGGLYGKFCQLDFDLHKQNPSEVPMFRDIVSHSKGCQKYYRIDLKTIADASREYDTEKKDDGSVPKVLDFSGIAFHESRCGSTLYANSMIAMNPEEHRVYSESAPPIAAIKNVCGETFQTCSIKQAAKILQDTIYLMSRSNDPNENYVFFKMQSIASRHINVFRKAFPDTPWIFIYRDPVQVMMSHLKYGENKANCLQSKRNPPKIIHDIARDRYTDYFSARDLSPCEYCAAHLASITETALDQIKHSNGMGIPINYVDIPKILYDKIIPHHFNIPINDEGIDNIIEVSSTYSKARNKENAEWKDDTKQKEEMANDEIRKAADVILGPSYLELQDIMQQSINALTMR